MAVSGVCSGVLEENTGKVRAFLNNLSERILASTPRACLRCSWVHAEGVVFLPSKHLLSALDDTPPSKLSGPLRLRVLSRSRTRLRIAASIAFLFRACFKEVLDTLVHHNAATRNAVMHNVIFAHRNSYPLFTVSSLWCPSLFSASPVIIFTSRTSPFRLCFHFAFRHNGLLYKTTRNLPRVTTQRCRHWQRGMAIANANAAMRCTKLDTFAPLSRGWAP